MNKIKIFQQESYFHRLENVVNEFAKNHKILNTSVCTEKHGYNIYYTIVVVYEEN